MKENWLETYYQQLEEKRTNISDSDFRFHNINRLPLIARKSLEFSINCPTCQSNMAELEALNNMLPSCLDQPGSLKDFEQKRNQIEKHLRKEHGMRHAHHYYALNSLLGLLAGSLLGMAGSWIVFNNFHLNVFLVLSALGLISGQIIGKRQDKFLHQNGKQI